MIVELLLGADDEELGGTEDDEAGWELDGAEDDWLAEDWEVGGMVALVTMGVDDGGGGGGVTGVSEVGAVVGMVGETTVVGDPADESSDVGVLPPGPAAGLEGLRPAPGRLGLMAEAISAMTAVIRKAHAKNTRTTVVSRAIMYGRGINGMRCMYTTWQLFLFEQIGRAHV